MESGQKVTWDCVWFGNYPQTEVVSESDTARLTAMKNMNTNYETKYETVTSAEFTQIENAAKNADSSGDFVVGSDKYRRIKHSDATYDGPYSWNIDDSYYYFKYEPIKWRVLNVENGKALLLADVALDDQHYNTDYTDITWEKSTIRSFLNNYGSSVNTVGNDYSSKGFLNNAFNTSERGAISTASLANADNLEYGTEGGNDTSDKIFLLSESDVWSTDTAESYGFVKDNNTNDEARQCKTSTYAYAMGAQRDYDSDEGKNYTYAGNCWWRLRSPGYYSTFAALVGNYGWGSGYGIFVSGNDFGVRPALYLNLSATDQYSLAGTVCSGGTVDEKAAPGSGGETEEKEKVTEDLLFTSKYCTYLDNDIYNSYINTLRKDINKIGSSCKHGDLTIAMKTCFSDGVIGQAERIVKTLSGYTQGRDYYTEEINAEMAQAYVSRLNKTSAYTQNFFEEELGNLALSDKFLSILKKGEGKITEDDLKALSDFLNKHFPNASKSRIRNDLKKCWLQKNSEKKLERVQKRHQKLLKRREE